MMALQFSNNWIVFVVFMWTPSTLEELKAQVMKAKSYQTKPKDIQTYVGVFEKYFLQFRYAANSEKVIEYFLQIFISSLHLTNQKIYECFKKLISWLNQDPNSKGAYYLIKNVVEICQREFPQPRLGPTDKDGESGLKQEDKQMKKRDKSKDREKSIQAERKQRPQQRSSETMRAHLKLVLSLVRKAGDKNMLIEDVYQIFIQYYLERISKQVEEQSKDEKQKSIKLGSHILSQLSSVLSARNKQQVVTVARNHLHQASTNNISCFISIYILLQLKNIPILLSPVLTTQTQTGKGTVDTKITYPRIVTQAVSNYLDRGLQDGRMDTILVVVLTKLIDLIVFCINSSYYHMIPQLYKLYPISQLSSSEQLIDRFFIHSHLRHLEGFQGCEPRIVEPEKWKQQFIENHLQYIQATSMSNPNSNILASSFVLKLYIFCQFLQGLTINQLTLDEDINQMVSIVKKELGNNANMTEWINQMQRLGKDCLEALNANSQKNQSSKQEEDLAIRQKITNHYKKIQAYKDLLQRLIESEKISSTLYQMRLKEINEQVKVKQSQEKLLQNWQIILQCIFQRCQSAAQEPSEPAGNEYYNQQSLAALQFMSVRPPVLKNQATLSYTISPTSMCFIDVLDLIIQEAEREEVTNYMKKLMSETFDRVDQQIIRDVIIKDMFLCKCLLLTNHTPKIKFMMDMLFSYYELRDSSQMQGRSDPHKQNIHRFLAKLLPGIPSEIIIQYCKFISSKDKLQMRMILFQKQCTQYSYLLDANLYDIAIKSKRNSVMTA